MGGRRALRPRVLSAYERAPSPLAWSSLKGSRTPHPTPPSRALPRRRGGPLGRLDVVTSRPPYRRLLAHGVNFTAIRNRGDRAEPTHRFPGVSIGPRVSSAWVSTRELPPPPPPPVPVGLPARDRRRGGRIPSARSRCVCGSLYLAIVTLAGFVGETSSEPAADHRGPGRSCRRRDGG